MPVIWRTSSRKSISRTAQWGRCWLFTFITSKINNRWFHQFSHTQLGPASPHTLRRLIFSLFIFYWWGQNFIQLLRCGSDTWEDLSPILSIGIWNDLPWGGRILTWSREAWLNTFKFGCADDIEARNEKSTRRVRIQSGSLNSLMQKYTWKRYEFPPSSPSHQRVKY